MNKQSIAFNADQSGGGTVSERRKHKVYRGGTKDPMREQTPKFEMWGALFQRTKKF